MPCIIVWAKLQVFSLKCVYKTERVCHNCYKCSQSNVIGDPLTPPIIKKTRFNIVHHTS